MFRFEKEVSFVVDVLNNLPDSLKHALVIHSYPMNNNNFQNRYNSGGSDLIYVLLNEVLYTHTSVLKPT